MSALWIETDIPVPFDEFRNSKEYREIAGLASGDSGLTLSVAPKGCSRTWFYGGGMNGVVIRDLIEAYADRTGVLLRLSEEGDHGPAQTTVGSARADSGDNANEPGAPVPAPAIEKTMVVCFQLDCDPVLMEQAAREIAAIQTHIPRFWVVNNETRERLNALFAQPKVSGQAVGFSLKIAAQDEDEVDAIIEDLSDIALARIRPGMRHLLGKSRHEALITGVFAGERWRCLKRVREAPAADPTSGKSSIPQRRR